MEEILRYIWLHGAERLASPVLTYVVLALVAAGSMVHSRMFRLKDIDGRVAALVVASMIIVSLSLLALLPGSPLLGITGSLFPSPWQHGLPLAVLTGCTVVSITFGLVSGTLHTWKSFLDNITYGISHWPYVIILGMIASVFI